MVIPAASFIEMAQDSLKRVDEAHEARQIAELRCALGQQNSDIEKGYLLGLQTARVILAGNPAAVLAKIIL